MTEPIPRSLGDGLVLRRATPADAEALASFHGAVHSDAGWDRPDERVGAWVRDLMSGTHPTFTPGDFTLVEETSTGRIVSSLCLISQVWSYEGMPFGVGQPELVSTHPDYRRRGLVREQFAVVHEWSAERGELVQGITGIPGYYRQFGYEPALELDNGRCGFKPHVPVLREGEEEPFRVRPAAEADLPFLRRLYEAGCRRGPVACVRDEAVWRYELVGKSRDSVTRRELCVVETAAGAPVGFLAHVPFLERHTVYALNYELDEGVSWLAATPAVARYLWSFAESAAAQRQDPEPESFCLWMHSEHPVFRVFGDNLPRPHKPYAWQLRVPDLPRFLWRIAPALEERLARSLVPGHTGELRLNFYRDGIKLCLERGRLAAIEPWSPPTSEGGDAAFPGRTFLQLLFGYRSLEELSDAYIECWTDRQEARVVLEALFPTRPSDLWWIA